MATPKTDITQSVGRILRVKHEKPIIVDLVDDHDIFQNQWTRRKTFYKKCNYSIQQIESSKYNGEDSEWKIVFDPKKKTKEEIKPVKCLIDTSIFNNL